MRILSSTYSAVVYIYMYTFYKTLKLTRCKSALQYSSYYLSTNIHTVLNTRTVYVYIILRLSEDFVLWYNLFPTHFLVQF